MSKNHPSNLFLPHRCVTTFGQHTGLTRRELMALDITESIFRMKKIAWLAGSRGNLQQSIAD
jgi:hypothetical protein